MKKALFFKIIIPILLELVAFSLTFVGGYYSNDAKKERIADYSARIASKQSDGDIFSLTVGSNIKSASLLPVDHEFYNLYGIFKQTKITFASTINASKNEHSIFLDDGSNSNLSMLYIGSVGTDKYNSHWKHRQFPIELMFEDDGKKARESSDKKEYPCYISQTQAVRILNKKNSYPDDYFNYEEKDYKSLLYSTIPVRIDNDNIFSFAIANIYFEENYYYAGVNSIMGDFIVCSYWLPMDLRLEQKSTYFMSTYSYQNRYFMDYINDTYASDNYVVSVNQFNIKGDIDTELVLSFRSLDNTNVFISSIFISFSSLLLATCLFLFHVFGTKYAFLITYGASIPPYLVFYLLSVLLKDVRWFSSFSCRLFFWFLISIFIVSILVKLIRSFRLKKTKIIYREYYEVTI